MAPRTKRPCASPVTATPPIKRSQRGPYLIKKNQTLDMNSPQAYISTSNSFTHSDSGAKMVLDFDSLLHNYKPLQEGISRIDNNSNSQTTENTSLPFYTCRLCPLDS